MASTRILHSFSHPHNRVPSPSGGEVVTKQSFKAECDINNILKQYQRTGIINHITANQPLYTDLPDQMDYQQSLDTVLSAQATFDTLPSLIRDHFQNDPSLFLAAFHDPAQKDFLREHGFLKPLPKPPMPATPDPAPPEAPAKS